uniref:DEAD/DEAH box helicase family protein n=1 Tax=Wolbachia endosymbiont of Pentidionis agamae TaxID=3110435 RepID=UPI002FD312CF
MSLVFYSQEFNESDLGDDESPLRKKFDLIVEDLKENKSTNLGKIKLISGIGNAKYFRAKLDKANRLLFTSVKHNDENAFVILEVILNHDYQKSKFLRSREKIKNIEIKNPYLASSPEEVELKDYPQISWLGKFITFSTTQKEIVEMVEECKFPLVVSGAAGSGKTSVALESLKKMQEKFEGEKILYITQSGNLIREAKKLFEYKDCDKIDKITGKPETCIPEEIEFLSLHEFFEKVIGEDVKEKKPIDRNTFFLWFNNICKKEKFKEYKKEGDKIFEEFTAVISGEGLGREKYKDLGSRKAIFSQDKRDHIYDLFEEYKKFIEENSKYYDSSLVAYEYVERLHEDKKVYDAVVIYEVQDLTNSILDLILKSLKDENKSNFLLCGDVNQVIHPSFFSLSKFK